MHLYRKAQRRPVDTALINPLHCTLDAVVDTATGQTMGVNHCLVQRSEVNPDLYLATITDGKSPLDTVFFELSPFHRAFMTQLHRPRGIVLEYRDELLPEVISRNVELFEAGVDDPKAYRDISEVDYTIIATVTHVQLSWEPVVFVEPLLPPQ